VLRHTFAVAAVQKGISLPALQRLLGHDRLTTTEIYLAFGKEVCKIPDKGSGQNDVKMSVKTESIGVYHFTGSQ
jgi:hypothetical protein